jgi:GTP-binding protein HflX
VFDRPHRGEKAILVHLTITHFHDQASAEEFGELARSAGAHVIAKITGTRPTPDSATFVGSGKLEEIHELVKAHDVEVVLFNHTLSPGQERNIEKALECRVLDRTGLILDIFAQRARSFEGKLQVELAQLQHLSTRLVRGWTHLERQRGGIGLRGPGETQLETDRRLLGERIKYIQKRLEKVSQQRELSRKARQKAELPIVSLVGYTNAGKSTLFNRLTHSSVYVADQLFATLDATSRRILLANKMQLVLIDTVGFIQQLPHDLVAAFRATLEETKQADLLLHVVDATDPERLQKITQVNQVLKEIDAQDVPQVLIYNKIDGLKDETAHLEHDESGKIHRVWLSAITGAGFNLLHQTLMSRLYEQQLQMWVRLPLHSQITRAKLFELAVVLQEQFAENGDSLLEIQIQSRDFSQLQKMESELQIISP